MDGLDDLDKNLTLADSRVFTGSFRVANDSELLNEPAPIAEIAVSEDVSERVFVLN